jgi:hypothetical protein
MDAKDRGAIRAAAARGKALDSRGRRSHAQEFRANLRVDPDDPVPAPGSGPRFA